MKVHTGYFSVILPPGLSAWHSVDSTLSRGAFRTEEEAHAWAADKVPGHPYTVRCYRCGGAA